jgi:hypothetical protein
MPSQAPAAGVPRVACYGECEAGSGRPATNNCFATGSVSRVLALGHKGR